MSNPTYVQPEYEFNPMQAVAAGKTGAPEVMAYGGAQAVGKIVFTGNLIADDTITVNGVVFTAKASGASGELEFNVDTTLSLSLDALITKLNGCTDPLVSYATYTKTDTDTAVTSTSDNYDYADNSKLLASTHSTVVVTQPTGGNAKPAISLNTENTQLVVPTGKLWEYTLAAGDMFQRKSIVNTGAGDASIVADWTGSNTTLVLNQNEYMTAHYIAGEWKTVVTTGGLS